MRNLYLLSIAFCILIMLNACSSTPGTDNSSGTNGNPNQTASSADASTSTSAPATSSSLAASSVSSSSNSSSSLFSSSSSVFSSGQSSLTSSAVSSSSLAASSAGSSSSLSGLQEYKLQILSAAASTENQPAANAIDGDTGSRWESAASDPQWIIFDLGSSKSLSKIILNWETASAADYTIDGSIDSNSWTTLASCSGLPSVDHRMDTNILSGSYQYIRMNGTARSTGWGYSIYDAKIYTKAVPGTLAYEVLNATASSGTSALLACDGSLTTRWESTQGVDPQWIIFDLGGSKPLSKIILDWEAASAADYTIDCSGDSITWTNLASNTGLPSVNHRMDTNALSGSYRYVRMNGTARSTGYGYSIWETYIY